MSFFIPAQWRRFTVNVVDCYFWVFLGFPHFPWVWSLIRIAACIRTTFLSNNIVAIYPPPRNPASGLVLCSGNDAIDGGRSCSHTAPLLPLLAVGGPPVKFRPGSLYDGAALIVPEDGNTRGIWRPPCCVHRWSGCSPCRNRLTTEAYSWSIIMDGQKYREWKEITKVRSSSRGNSGLPPGLGYCSAPDVARYAKVHWQVQWLWIPCWLLYFEVYLSFILTDECDRSFGLLLYFLTT